MTSAVSYPDLTQRPPRSPRLRLGDYALLPRILDKARAANAGKLGEFRYNGRGMDRHFFNFTGLDHDALQAEVAKGGGDGESLAWVILNAKHPRQPWEIAAWSAHQENRAPASDAETLADFAAAVAAFTTTREDVRTWFDLLDLDDHCTFWGKA